MAGSLPGNPYAVRPPLQRLQLSSHRSDFLIREGSLAGAWFGSGECVVVRRIEEDWSGTLRGRADLQAGDHMRFICFLLGGEAVGSYLDML